MTAFNDNHKRHLLQTFEYVDKLLSAGFSELTSAESPSPFQRTRADSLPIQRRVIGDYLERLRAAMTRILQYHGVQLREPDVSSIWSFRTSVIYAGIAIEELAPKYMRGYGDLSEDACRDLDLINAELTALLNRMDGYLAAGSGKELRNRLQRLAQTSCEREWVGLLENIITAHGLVELRPLLDIVVTRMESPKLEVAVFGRVSSGKSSLLNYILKTNVLPVGVTPVTAVPTRISYGSQPRARIWLAESEPMTVEPEELATYVTEQGNPDNAKRVTRLQLELPNDRLKDVTFVDTPGLGSVSRNGTLESQAYLPHCDVGIVLVDASSALSPEDSITIDALSQAGADVMVLLNKIDLLAPADRSEILAYVTDRLRIDLGQEVPVHLASMKGKDTVLCDQWFDEALRPLLDDRQRLAGAYLHRKLALLHEATATSIQRRLLGKAVGSPSLEIECAAQRELNEGLAALEAAERTTLTFDESAFLVKVLESVSRSTRDEWRRGGTPTIDVGPRALTVAQELASSVAVEEVKLVTRLSEFLADCLRQASNRSRHSASVVELPIPSGMPTPEFSNPPRLSIPRPIVPVLGDYWASWKLARELHSLILPWLQGSIDLFVTRLRAWKSGTLAEIRRAYTASMEFHLSQLGQSTGASDPQALERDLKRLKELRKTYEIEAHSGG